MNRYSPTSVFVFVLTSIIVILAIVSGCLYHQNKKYESQNRKLIIQNDSIQSVNIELKHSIKLKSAADKKAGVLKGEK
jgi:hypothetical protein